MRSESHEPRETDQTKSGRKLLFGPLNGLLYVVPTLHNTNAATNGQDPFFFVFLRFSTILDFSLS